MLMAAVTYNALLWAQHCCHSYINICTCSQQTVVLQTTREKKAWWRFFNDRQTEVW